MSSSARFPLNTKRGRKAHRSEAKALPLQGITRRRGEAEGRRAGHFIHSFQRAYGFHETNSNPMLLSPGQVHRPHTIFSRFVSFRRPPRSRSPRPEARAAVSPRAHNEHLTGIGISLSRRPKSIQHIPKQGSPMDLVAFQVLLSIASGNN